MSIISGALNSLSSAAYGSGSVLIYTAGKEASREYLNPSKNMRPSVRLLISPFIPPAAPIELVSKDFGGLITSVIMGKSRSRPAGDFTVTLAADDAQVARSFEVGQPLRAIWNELGASLEDLFKPMTLGLLIINGYHVMTGILRTRKRLASIDSATKTYILQFEELGQLYNESILTKQLVLHGYQSNVLGNQQKILDGAATLTGLPLVDIIHQLVQKFLISSLNFSKGWPRPYFRSSDGLPVAYRMVARKAPLGGLANTSIIQTAIADSTIFNHAAGQSFWGYIQSLCPEPWMELFTESGGRTIVTGRLSPTRQELLNAPAAINAIRAGIPKLSSPGSVNISVLMPGFNYLIMRSTPYDNPYLGIGAYPSVIPFLLGVFDLIIGGDFVIITDDDVNEKTLGVSDVTQKTVFSVMHTGGQGGLGGMLSRPSVAGGPLIPTFPGGVRTFGNRFMERHISATSLSQSGLTNQLLEKADRTHNPVYGGLPLSNLLNVWFRNQHLFREGSVTTRLIPYARPGMMLLYLPRTGGRKSENVRDLGMYYIDNVSHGINVGQAPTTTFSLTRGTPMPLSTQSTAILLAGWEMFPPGPGLFDGEAR